MPCENSRFKVGQVIGLYTLIECKGEGGFGEVWKAQRKNVMAAPPVALKLSRYPQLHQNAVRKEAELWVKATGLPNVLPVIEASVYNNEVAIVSHYVEGGTLTQWLQRYKGKAPSVAAAVEIMAGILMGLEGLHSRGIVHRDLKPDNILMQGEMPLLTDFGISRIVESTTAYTQQAMGTLHYMPPEAFETNEKNQPDEKKIQVSKKSDQWAAAVILYRLLTGQLPFPQKELGPYMNAVCNQHPPSLPNTIPAHIKRVLVRALQKAPEKRFASAAAMRTALLTPDSSTQRPSERLNFLNPLLNRLNQWTVSSSRRASEHPVVAAVRKRGASAMPNPHTIAPTASNEIRLSLQIAPPVVKLYIALLGIGVCFQVFIAYYQLFASNFSGPGHHYYPQGAMRYMLIIGTLIFTLWVLLRIPIRLSQGCKVRSDELLLPIIVSGFWFATLILGGIYFFSINFSWAVSKFPAEILTGISWVSWSFLFYRLTRTTDFKSHIKKQMRLLLLGGLVETLIAMLSCIEAYSRNNHQYIINYVTVLRMGLAVIMLSFAPAMFFFYHERVGKRSR